MIDIVTYRFRVGVFNANVNTRHIKQMRSGNKASATGSILDFLDGYINSSVIFYIVYVLFICHFSLFVLTSVGAPGGACPGFNKDFRAQVPNVSVSLYCRYFIAYFIMHILSMFYIRNNYCFAGFHAFLRISIIKNSPFTGRIGKAFTECIIWLFALNLVLIVLANPAIVNPGPACVGDNTGSINVYFQNVQGLIPFGELNSAHPMLDSSKCLEISTYLKESRIDIAILNETWLKKSVVDSEFLPLEHYKIFRTDRSTKTHPPDPNNPTRFRRNGGEVMIAVKTDLQLESKEIN